VKKLRYFIETLAVKTLAWTMRTLPHHVVLVLAKLVGAVAYLADARGRETALENLRVAFHDTLSWRERHRITRRSYQNFARNFFDLFWCASLTKETWREHFTFDVRGADMRERLDQGGLVWVTPHFGIFELSSLVWGWLGYSFSIIAQDFKNTDLTAIFREAREVSGHVLIPQQNAMLRLIKAMTRGGHSAFLSDLNVKPSKVATVIQCFGLNTCVTTLHVVLAQRLKLKIQPAICIPQPDGRYIVRVFDMMPVPAEATPQQVAQQCWDIFEQEVRAQPELWMWMYKHWRYLPGTQPDARYPDYANASGEFRKLLRPQG
jgi:lauroyl/myristoyl acyltransferase